MNVLFVHQAAELYGSDRVLLALVESLTQSGFVTPIVVLPQEGPLLDEFRRIGVEVHVTALAKVQRSAFTPLGLLRFASTALRSVKGLDAVVAGRRIDVVHSNTVAVVSGGVWSRVRRVHHVWHVHEIILRPKLVAKALAWLVSLLSDKVVGISGMVRDNLIAQCPRLARQTVVVPNGMVPPTRDIAAARHAWRSAEGLSDQHIVIGLIGRINAGKGQGLLLHALRRIIDAGHATQMRVVIVGSPPPGQDELLQQLERQIEELGVRKHVSVLPFRPDVWPIWCGMDIAVVPSTHPEAFGMVALEAMFAERPVVAANHGGVVDIVRDGETGLLVPPGDEAALSAALVKLSQDAELCRRMGRAGRERAKAVYSLTAQADAFRNLYAHPEALGS